MGEVAHNHGSEMRSRIMVLKSTYDEEACMKSFTKALLCTPNPCSRLWPAGRMDMQANRLLPDNGSV